jgi:hypothetical protein
VWPQVTVALALIASATPWAQAGDIAIRRDGCRAGVHLAARDARLSSVLERLAEALDFRLHFESDDDPTITIDDFLHADDMLPRLAEAENFTVARAPDPACPLQSRIVGVWVLPHGGAARMGVASTSATAVDANAAAAEQERRAQEGIKMYLKAHGFPAEEKQAR